MATVKRLEDLRTMRALAHPLRLRLLGLLRIEGPQTATKLAGLTGESVPSVSYHLRQLAEHGFIEDAPELARDHRERWWRASHERTSWKTVEFLDAPEQLAAESALKASLHREHFQAIRTWNEEQATWSREWIDASDTSDWILDLTPEQLRSLRDELHELIERRRNLPREDDAEHVAVVLHLFPRKPAR